MATPTSGRPGRALLVLLVITIAMGGWMVWQGVNTPKLGLDLQGGTTVTLVPSAVPGEEGEITDDSINQAVEIISARVNGAGVAEAEVAPQGSGEQAVIVVSVPGLTEDDLVEQLGQTAQLGFRPVLDAQPNVPATPTPTPTPTDGTDGERQEERHDQNDSNNGGGNGALLPRVGPTSATAVTGERAGKNDKSNQDNRRRPSRPTPPPRPPHRSRSAARTISARAAAAVRRAGLLRPRAAETSAPSSPTTSRPSPVTATALRSSCWRPSQSPGSDVDTAQASLAQNTRRLDRQPGLQR